MTPRTRGWLIFLAAVLVLVAIKLLKFPVLVAMGRMAIPMLCLAALLLLLVLRPWRRKDAPR